MNKAIVTGASGLLGRAILKSFDADPGWEVVGLAKSRARDGLLCHDLLHADATEELLQRERPTVVIHAAAERKPDVCEGRPEFTQALNVTASSTLCEAAKAVDAWVLFISTDYVFDGTQPPYHPRDTPHPLNAYGESKLGGEEATLRVNPGNAALRVPILYGEVERLEESAVTEIACSLLDSTPVKMDHWAVRRPTLVDDVGSACLQLANHQVSSQSCRGIWHFSGDESMTKYDMALAMGRVIGLDSSHIEPDEQPPPGAPRPHDCSLDCAEFDARCSVVRSSFTSVIGDFLRPHLP
ncbi:MAG: NAD(P)-dependent oxidoreductase [Opitutae bacterium]|nr:NAD(P)-dependent oxidoreductase [Opitutae bacterium]|tara:strand:+ start:13300 stop:14190 length:891 start_codon:yes stop_codon:yes gene_type:complete